MSDRLERLDGGLFKPLGERAAAVLGGFAAIQRFCIGGYTIIDGVAYPNYIVDTDTPTTNPTTEPATPAGR